jgi:hypothetical protein
MCLLFTAVKSHVTGNENDWPAFKGDVGKLELLAVKKEGWPISSPTTEVIAIFAVHVTV